MNQALPPFGWNIGTCNFSPYPYRSNYTNCSITVQGTGTVTAKPDQAIISLGIVVEDEDLEKAKRQNTLISNQVLDGLKKIGIDENNIKTISYSINPVYNYTDGKKTFKGYEVRHFLKVTINDTSKVGLVINVAIQNGAEVISNVQFTISNPDPYYDEALEKALMNAQKKAEVIANSLEVNIQQTPSKIIENSSSVGRHFVNMPYSATNGVMPPIQEGEIQITAFITAKFQYVCFE